MTQKKNWDRRTMPAQPQLTTQPIGFGPILRIWSPEDDQFEAPHHNPDAHAIRNPVRRKTRGKQPAPGQKALWDISPLDPAVAVAAQQIQEEHRPVTLNSDQRAWLRTNLTIRGLYSDWMQPSRLRLVEQDELSRETLAKDRQAITRWEKFTTPKGWPKSSPWPGVPLGSISGPLVDAFVLKMKSSLADTTAKTTLCHFKTIIHAGQRLGLIDPMEISGVSVERKEARVYSFPEAIAIYRALASRLDLQSAFVLSLAAGPRSRDLFGAPWDALRFGHSPRLRFTAVKTGIHHCIPLAPVVVRHLERLPRESKWIFPRLSNQESKDPERSQAARDRNEDFKTVLLSLGIFDRSKADCPVEHPWHVGRSTAATWIETAGRGLSSILLGHSSDDDAPRNITRTSYLPSELEPSPRFTAGVNSVVWPEPFLEI